MAGNGGKQLTGKLYEPFERADGGRASQLDLLRLYTVDRRAAKRAGREGPGPMSISVV
jgi:hypothetical protein